MPTADIQPDLEFPRSYGRYELLERIGEGGMAEVFRARLRGIGGFEKILAIKRILPQLSRNKRFVQMFVNEARLAAKLQHRNIVQVHELGQLDDGELYIAMEYVPGIDLRGILRNAAQRVLRIPIWFSVYSMAEVAGGLAHAHEALGTDGQPIHIVHRDVTPSNVFISPRGDVKIADFGIAMAAGKVGVTRSGQLKGKISYMPPEQLHGQPLDGRADVFAAGVVLWECLTQRRLFGGRPDFETMLAVCGRNREPPSRYNSRVPPELDALTLRALDPDRDQRVSSAREFQTALLDALSHLRPRLLPHELQHVVAVIVGQRPADPRVGADIPHDSSLPGDRTRPRSAPPRRDSDAGFWPEAPPTEVSAYFHGFESAVPPGSPAFFAPYGPHGPLSRPPYPLPLNAVNSPRPLSPAPMAAMDPRLFGAFGIAPVRPSRPTGSPETSRGDGDVEEVPG